MKYEKTIFTILLFLLLGSENLVFGQTPVQYDSLGISITLPNSWSTQTPVTSAGFFEAYSKDSSAIIRISKRSVSDQQNSLTYLMELERILEDTGYSPIDLDGVERYKVYEKDSDVNADDAAIGIYMIQKKGINYLEYITVFHKENIVYLNIIQFPLDNMEYIIDDFKLLSDSFKINP